MVAKMVLNLRDLFADELGADPGLAARVRDGTDNSIGGTAAIRAMEKAVAAERERCAKIVETLPMPHRWQGDPLTGSEVREVIAAAIRKGEP